MGADTDAEKHMRRHTHRRGRQRVRTEDRARALLKNGGDPVEAVAGR
ncbi:hypothetical protein [Streptomyces sp. NPDC003719]